MSQRMSGNVGRGLRNRRRGKKRRLASAEGEHPERRGFSLTSGEGEAFPGTIRALANGMDLYHLKGLGFHSPLSEREITQLYRNGDLSPRHPCKPRCETRWQTVDEVFPLLRYAVSAPPLRFEESGSVRPNLRVISAIALGLAGLATALFYFRSSAPTTTGFSRPVHPPILTSGGQFSEPVATGGAASIERVRVAARR